MSARPLPLVCLECSRSFAGGQVRYRCECGGTLDVCHDLAALRGKLSFDTWDRRLSSRDPLDRSGVWRYRELVLPLHPEAIVTRGEGNTGLYRSEAVARYVGIPSFPCKHEGENPTGSFKDRGMTVAISAAKSLGLTRVACASTGNTSAAMASYAAIAGMKAYVFIPEGQVAYGKLSQALAYGARTIQIAGDFDAAMDLVQKVCAERGVYLCNSVNPLRIEGQKAILFELLQDLDWIVPDWIVMPGGNLGNSAAIGKALRELAELGLITKLPRLAVIQAAGANPLARAFKTKKWDLVPVRAETLATAIRIGNPASWKRSLRELAALGGVVEEVSDQEIMDAKAIVDAAGIGAEPASCATVAGARKLAGAGAFATRQTVCGILTGHLLKDPDAVIGYHKGELPGIRSTFANAPVRTAADLESVLREIS